MLRSKYYYPYFTDGDPDTKNGDLSPKSTHLGTSRVHTFISIDYYTWTFSSFFLSKKQPGWKMCRENRGNHLLFIGAAPLLICRKVSLRVFL